MWWIQNKEHEARNGWDQDNLRKLKWTSKQNGKNGIPKRDYDGEKWARKHAQANTSVITHDWHRFVFFLSVNN